MYFFISHLKINVELFFVLKLMILITNKTYAKRLIVHFRY